MSRRSKRSQCTRSVLTVTFRHGFLSAQASQRDGGEESRAFLGIRQELHKTLLSFGDFRLPDSRLSLWAIGYDIGLTNPNAESTLAALSRPNWPVVDEIVAKT